MKLSDLTATVTGPRFKRILVGLSQKTFEQLTPYRENREAGGFIRLATEMLLTLTDDGESIELLADKLTVHCDSVEDLGMLMLNCAELARQLKERWQSCVKG